MIYKLKLITYTKDQYVIYEDVSKEIMLEHMEKFIINNPSRTFAVNYEQIPEGAFIMKLIERD